jgi:hypothetical protein
VNEHPKDWRLQRQETYLQGANLFYRQYHKSKTNDSWDHDHCEFCSVKVKEEPQQDVITSGHCTKNEYHWVCPTCFNDFKALFVWKLLNE